MSDIVKAYQLVDAEYEAIVAGRRKVELEAAGTDPETAEHAAWKARRAIDELVQLLGLDIA